MRKSDEQKQAEAASKRLKELIEELGINQSEFAQAIGTSFKSINGICTNTRNLSEGMAAKIGLKYGINPQWLLSGEGQKYASGEAGELQKKNQLQKIAAIRETIQQLTQQLDDLENEVRK